MRINLPNPADYLHKEEQFFEQLELAIYHAKKSWEKVRKNYSEEDVKNEIYPWLAFRHTNKIEEAVEEAIDKNGERVDPDREELCEISIEVAEL